MSTFTTSLQLLRTVLPPDQLEELDLSTLTLSTESFIKEEFKESFSDLIYFCDSKTSEKVRICLLFEHKSRPTGRLVYTQVGGYLNGVQIEDINQNRPMFSLTIPILFYHGKASWNVPPLRTQYGNVPDSMQGYVPHFDFIFVNLQQMPDEEIFAMEDAMLLRNIFLAFKHASEDDFFRQYFREVLIFAGNDVTEENLLTLFYSTFLYIQFVTSIKKQEIMEIVQTFPPEYAHRVKSTYEQVLDEGIEKGRKEGMEEGIEKGMETLVRNIITNRPDYSDQYVADLLNVPISLVARVRASQ